MHLAKSNVIHLIGLSYNKEYLPYILPYLDDADNEIRYKAIIACGWLGDAEAIKILKEHYATEKMLCCVDLLYRLCDRFF